MPPDNSTVVMRIAPMHLIAAIESNTAGNLSANTSLNKTVTIDPRPAAGPAK
jgi:hypothetical protein